jgi:hypothetical protein
VEEDTSLDFPRSINPQKTTKTKRALQIAVVILLCIMLGLYWKDWKNEQSLSNKETLRFDCFPEEFTYSYFNVV